ncbi:MAG: helix-turn-helix domain-containing protein [Ekhidna sp.]
MSVLRLILLSQAFLAIFVAGGLFFKYDDIKGRSIAFFVFLFGFEIGVFLYGTSQVIFLYPQFAGIFFFPLGFMYGPLLLLHILTVQNTSFNQRKFWIHFIPALVMILLLHDIYAMSGMERIIYFSENFINRIMPYNYARALHILIYGVVCVVLVKKHAYKDAFNKLYSFAICLIYFFSSILISFFTLFADGWRDFIYYYLSANIIVITIGYLLYSKPHFLKNISVKYFGSSLSKETMEQIKISVHDLVVESEAFLNKGLNLKMVADEIGETNHRISQTMTILVGKKFNDYVNSYRIEYAKKMLSNTSFDHYKIEAIALDSGFSNKVTFHKYFVKSTGLTPTVFRSNQKN